MDLSKDFHVYGLEWNEKQLMWYFDGKAIRERNNDIQHSEVAVIFSTAVLKWAGEITDTLDGSSMDIDYVRVYQYEDDRRGVRPSLSAPSSHVYGMAAGSRTH